MFSRTIRCSSRSIFTKIHQNHSQWLNYKIDIENIERKSSKKFEARNEKIKTLKPQLTKLTEN